MVAMNRRRNMLIVIGALSVFLLTAIVFAAAAGLLTFTGTALLNPGLKIDIVDEEIIGPDLSGDEEIRVVGEGQTLLFTVYLDVPGATRNVEFSLENVGNTAAQLGTFDVVDDAPQGINVTWPNFANEVLEPTDVKGPFVIEVEWDDAVEDPSEIGILTGDYFLVEFSATLSYNQYIAP
jgi:hypothetical protein